MYESYASKLQVDELKLRNQMLKSFIKTESLEPFAIDVIGSVASSILNVRKS